MERWREVWDTLRANPGRTALTMAGVFWGSFMLVAMLGFSSGLEDATHRTVRGTVTNAGFVWGQRTRLPYRGFQPGRPVVFRNRDLPALEKVPGVAVLAPRHQLGGYRDGTPVMRDGESGAFSIMGDMPAYGQISTVVWDRGRFIHALDVAQRRKVAVIGREVYRVLWPDGGDPIGDWILIRGAFFQVVGLFHSADASQGGDREENTIHIPFSTFQQVFDLGDRVGWIAYLADEGVATEVVEERLKALLRRRHGVHPEDTSALGSFNAGAEFRRVQNLFLGIRGLTWLVGIATLLSGSVAVSNVLLIMVRERTQEIGLRRALGATPASIVAMILREALVMTAGAGVAGLVVGMGLVELAAVLIGPDNPSFGVPRVVPTAALAATAVLLLVGAAAGLLPARRAVAIQPVDALRAE